jgi:hypothetical protein
MADFLAWTKSPTHFFFAKMDADTSFKGFVTKCKEGAFKTPKRYWLELCIDDGPVLLFYSKPAATKPHRTESLRKDVQLIHDPKGPWTSDTDPACRVLIAILRVKCLYLETDTPDDARVLIQQLKSVLQQLNRLKKKKKRRRRNP